MRRLIKDYKRTTQQYFVMYINQTITFFPRKNKKSEKSETLKHLTKHLSFLLVLDI